MATQMSAVDQVRAAEVVKAAAGARFRKSRTAKDGQALLAAHQQLLVARHALAKSARQRQQRQA